MERDELHELSAAYALDALEPHDAAEFEEHLSTCPRCRAEVASFRAPVGALGFAAPGAEPSPDLRERILEQARSERAIVVPIRRRWPLPVAAAVAAAAACAALVLGIWAASLSSQLGDERAARAQEERAVAVAFEPGAQHYAVEGAEGTLAVAEEGQGALILSGLDPAPEGHVYRAWVSADGKRMLPAGDFDAEDGSAAVPLTRSVPEGGLVAVTLEPEDAPGDRPTDEPILVARTA